MRARLVVAADGAGSRVRALAGLTADGWLYGQRGLVATVALRAPSASSAATSEEEGGGACGETAWQRFLPTGPLALLPVR